MFWVAEYKNGLALPEYDESSGQVNSFSHVNHKDVLRFWWLPVTARMAQMFPNLRVNPRLKRHAVDLDGSKGYVARRMEIKLGLGNSLLAPLRRVKCYVLGIENGPRIEIYPDGVTIGKEYPERGETQELLHG